MKMKWINRIIFTGILSWLAFSVCHYLLQEFLIKNEDLNISFGITSKSDAEFVFSFNDQSSQVGIIVHKIEVKGSENRQYIDIPLPDNVRIRRIFLTTTQENHEFYLDSIHISNSYIPIEWNTKEIIDVLKYGNDHGKTSTEFNVEENKIHLTLTKEFPFVLFTHNMVDKMYGALYDHLRNASIGFGLMAWILLLLLFRFAKFKRLDPNYQLNFCAFFLAVLFTPFFTQKENSTTENRPLAAFPNLKSNIWKIPGQYTAYYDDHFPYRNDISRIDNLMKIKGFGVSPKPQFVQFGKENWLYCSVNEIRNSYQRTEGWTDKELERITRKLEKQHEVLSKNGIDFYVMIAPLKHSVYPEYLPRNLRQHHGVSKRNQLIEYLKKNSSVQLIDPYPVLVAKKDSVQVYYKNDTHWNQLGAYFAYRLMINTMAKKHPNLKPLKLSDFEIERSTSYTGDLVAMMNIDSLFSRETYNLIPKFKRRAGDVKMGERMGSERTYLYYEADSLDAPKILIYRDSYTEYLRRNISETFSYTGLVWSYELDQDRIINDKPDIVMLEIMERFITRLLPPETEETLEN